MKVRSRWFLGIYFLFIFLLLGFVSGCKRNPNSHSKLSLNSPGGKAIWIAPDIGAIPHTSEGELIRYGRSLIVNTSWYLGPNGKVASSSNGMNCQNCHLEGGSKMFGNNYSAVYANYPKYRDRSGKVENIFKRINDCVERSLNGTSLDSNSREMKAISSYINWMGHAVPKGKKPQGSGISDLKFLDRAADTVKGHTVYMQYCRNCHGPEGEGLKKVDATGYIYPPLWGKHSFTTAAGLYRISRMAGFVADNMPFGSTHQHPGIAEDKAWDVAAFINSQPRPNKKYPKDWPNLSGKPIDYPFGPYSDQFSEIQHKYGPFDPVQNARLKESQLVKREESKSH